jgi:ribosome recycling factor
MIKELVLDAEKRMKSTIQSLEDDLAGVRTGRASPALVERMSIESACLNPAN